VAPIIFLDLDDVLAISEEFTSYQVTTLFKQGNRDSWPELWKGLFFAEGKENLAKLHGEFSPQYVISSSWATYLSREQIKELFSRCGLEFVAKNLHKHWTTPKGEGPSRRNEIENWVKKHLQDNQPMLVLDDKSSGWSLPFSDLTEKNQIVLCEEWVGFVANKLLEARIYLHDQRWYTESASLSQLAEIAPQTTLGPRP